MEQAKKHFAQNAHTQGEIKQSHASASQSGITKQFSNAITVDTPVARPLSQKHQDALEARGVNLEVAARMNWREGQNDTIEIPYYKNGIEVNCKTRTIIGEKRFFQRQGGEKCLYNVDSIRELGEADLIVTEGEMDAIIALQCGFIAVSVPDGAPSQAIGDKETVKYDYLSDIPPSIKRIILAVDTDAAGINLMNDLALRLGKHRCMWVKYPVGCKDLNDAFIKYGEAGVRKSIANARYVKVSGLFKLSDLPPLPEFTAYDVGISGLEEHFKLRQGDFSVITGIPSHGKSTFANNLAFNMANNHGWHVCFASFEQPPQTEHRDALSTLFNGRPAYLQNDSERVKADAWINENISFITPDDDADGDFDLTWLMDAMAAAVTRYNAKLIIIDPWNELDHIYNQQQVSMTQYVGMAIKELKRFAKKFMVHVMVIAHPAKMKKDKDGVYPVPSAYDISDSSHWYNKPEQVVVIHRQENGTTLARIAKSRYHNKLGKPADIELVFNDYNNRYNKA